MLFSPAPCSCRYCSWNTHTCPTLTYRCFAAVDATPRSYCPLISSRSTQPAAIKPSAHPHVAARSMQNCRCSFTPTPAAAQPLAPSVSQMFRGIALGCQVASLSRIFAHFWQFGPASLLECLGSFLLTFASCLATAGWCSSLSWQSTYHLT